MPKGKPHEESRKEVWFTMRDVQHIEALAKEMEKLGVDPFGRGGNINYSKVVRYALGKSTRQKLGT